MGGYQAIITSIIFLLIGGYTNFKYYSSFMKRLYFQKNDTTDDELNERRSDADEMIEKINNRRDFNVNYITYFLMSWLEYCCCCMGCLKRCCKPYRTRLKEYEKFENANKEIYKEIDLEYLIYHVRVLKMLMRANTKKRQRKSVMYFKRYMIEDGDKVKPNNLFGNDMAAESMIENFDAVGNEIDRRILYELTGRKLDPEDYWDDSD